MVDFTGNIIYNIAERVVLFCFIASGFREEWGNKMHG
jgi:hypothetical protein